MARLAVCDLVCDSAARLQTALASCSRPTRSDMASGARSCTMTKYDLVPCSIAAPPSNLSANVHRQVTRQLQCVVDLIYFVFCAAPPAPRSTSCACFASPRASSPIRSLTGWRSLQQEQGGFGDRLCWATKKSLPRSGSQICSQTEQEMVLVRKRFRPLLDCASQHSHRIRLLQMLTANCRCYHVQCMLSLRSRQKASIGLTHWPTPRASTE